MNNKRKAKNRLDELLWKCYTQGVTIQEYKEFHSLLRRLAKRH